MEQNNQESYIINSENYVNLVSSGDQILPQSQDVTQQNQNVQTVYIANPATLTTLESHIGDVQRQTSDGSSLVTLLPQEGTLASDTTANNVTQGSTSENTVVATGSQIQSHQGYIIARSDLDLSSLGQYFILNQTPSAAKKNDFSAQSAMPIQSVYQMTNDAKDSSSNQNSQMQDVSSVLQQTSDESENKSSSVGLKLQLLDKQKGKIQPLKKEQDVLPQIFSQVKATLCDSLIYAIPGSKAAYFQTLESQYQVHIDFDPTQNTFAMNGELKNLLNAHQLLASLIMPQSGISEDDMDLDTVLRAMYPIRKRGEEKTTQTDLNQADKAIHCEINQRQFSRSGREVKEPSLELISEVSSFKVQRSQRRSARTRKVFKRKLEPTLIVNDTSKSRKKDMETSTEEKIRENDNDISGIGHSETDVKDSELKKSDSEKENLGVDSEDSNMSQSPKCEEELTSERDIQIKEELDPDFQPGEQRLLSEQFQRKPVHRSSLKKKDYEKLAPFKFFCKMCSFKSKRVSHFEKHMKLHDKGIQLLNCERCDFRTLRLSHLRRHELNDHSDKNELVKCQQPGCKYRTDSQKHLERHSRIKHQMKLASLDIETTLTCSQCSYKTTKPKRLQRHLKCHMPAAGAVNDGTIGYQCELCIYKTVRRDLFLRHMNNVHCNARPFLCDTCGQGFKRRDALAQHKVVHLDKQKRFYPFQCTICNKGFRSQAHLNEHKTRHSNVRAYLCEICGASFKTRSVQRKHVLTIHRNPRSYPCTVCEKKFNTKYGLIRHERIHDIPANKAQTAQPGVESTISEQIGILSESQESDQAPRVVIDINHQEDGQPVQVISAHLGQDIQAQQIVTTETLPTAENQVEPLVQTTEEIQLAQNAYVQGNETTTAILYLSNFQTY